MNRILIPIDFSELSEYAFSIAKEIQLKTNAELIGLNVVHVGKSALYKSDGTLSDSNDFDVEAVRKQQAENEQKMQDFLKNVPNSRGVVKIGNIEDIILNCEKDEEIDLIIMGTHGSSGLAQQISGTIADKIVRKAQASVITLKCKRDTSEFKDILLVSDFDQAEKDNIAQLKEVAAIFGAKLHLLKVNLPSSTSDAEAIKARMAEYCKLNGLENVDFHIVESENLEDGITKFADENGIEFIAIGSKGRMGISALFRGCISADLVNHLYKPVFTFRA